MEFEQDARDRRPLFIAAGIAVVVMAGLGLAGVDLHRCEFEAATKSEHTASRGDDEGPLDRKLRLWLDAGELDAVLQGSLDGELSGTGITLTSAATKGGSVTLRVDDASLYTPLYANARVTAVMGFETGSAQGETRVELEGGCYGAVAPSTFRARVARQVAAPLAKALDAALNASAR